MIALLTLTASPALAWGPTGHRVVAELAWNALRPRTRRKLNTLLGDESLAEGATWPDWIRSDPDRPNLGSWHYVSIDDDDALAALPNTPGPHVVWAIGECERRLGDTSLDRQTRLEALRWLVHLVGDIHQPLHVGKSADRGGNLVDVTWMGTSTNLHKLWDEDLIDHERLSYTELTAMLTVPEAQAAAWRSDPPQTWAAESYALRDVVYDIGDGNLSWAYRYRALPIVHERLQQAGTRLAARLDATLSR